jgi:hypothetical protein
MSAERLSSLPAAVFAIVANALDSYAVGAIQLCSRRLNASCGTFLDKHCVQFAYAGSCALRLLQRCNRVRTLSFVVPFETCAPVCRRLVAEREPIRREIERLRLSLRLVRSRISRVFRAMGVDQTPGAHRVCKMSATLSPRRSRPVQIWSRGRRATERLD